MAAETVSGCDRGTLWRLLLKEASEIDPARQEQPDLLRRQARFGRGHNGRGLGEPMPSPQRLRRSREICLEHRADAAILYDDTPLAGMPCRQEAQNQKGIGIRAQVGSPNKYLLRFPARFLPSHLRAHAVFFGCETAHNHRPYSFGNFFEVSLGREWGRETTPCNGDRSSRRQIIGEMPRKLTLS